MRIAGGKWETFTGDDGKPCLRLEFLVPPRGKVQRERAQLTGPELRERLVYTGTLIEMLEDDGKKQKNVLRCFGSMEHIGAPITPVEEGVAAEEVQATPALSRFSLVKTDTTRFTKLVPTVKVRPAISRSVASPISLFRFQTRARQDAGGQHAQTAETVPPARANSANSSEQLPIDVRDGRHDACTRLTEPDTPNPEPYHPTLKPEP
jgi:hypothetical protein